MSKRWSVRVIADGQSALRYIGGGGPLESAAGAVANVSPVEHFLMSVAGCFALSCRAVIAARKLAPASFEVVVAGDKAEGLPSRVARIEVTANFPEAISSADAETIAAEAKALCTVSNSIVASPAITYVSRITSASHSAPADARSDLPA